MGKRMYPKLCADRRTFKHVITRCLEQNCIAAKNNDTFNHGSEATGGGKLSLSMAGRAYGWETNWVCLLLCKELCARVFFSLSHSFPSDAVCLSLSRCLPAPLFLYLFVGVYMPLPLSSSLPLVFCLFPSICLSLSLSLARFLHYLSTVSVRWPLIFAVGGPSWNRLQHGRRRARLRRTTRRSSTAAAASWAIRRTSATRKS